jgi:proteasome lid subunit RPN8/RPN11
LTALLPSDPTHSDHLIATGGLRARRVENAFPKLSLGTRHDLILLCQRNREEICGFLTDKEEIFLVKNSHAEPRYNYHMSIEDGQKVVDEIYQLRKSKIMGIFHTHPNNQPWPSPRDLVGWPKRQLGWRYWIATHKELIEWQAYYA